MYTTEVFDLAPPELRRWLMDFEWSAEKLWRLPLPQRELAVSELEWILELPWWKGEGDDAYFQVRPLDVLDGWHEARVAAADLSWPLHVIRRQGRWVVLDGIHRLLKAKRLGFETVRVCVVREYLLGAIAA